MDDVAVGPLDLAARVDDALAVQALAFGLSDEEIAVRRHIVLRHLACPGARALGATTPAGRLVGFVYGMPNDRAHWWSTVVEPYLRGEGLDHWLDDSFIITELHVHPAYQHRGIGRALITRITDEAARTALHPLRHRHREPGPPPVPLPRLPATSPAASSSPAPPPRTP